MTLYLRVAVLVLAALAVRTIGFTSPAIVTYEGVPAEISTITAFEWRDDGPPREVDPQILRKGGEVRIVGPAGRRTVLIFRRQDGRYLIDGPITWPDSDARRELPRGFPNDWRHGVDGRVPIDVAADATAEWISPDANAGAWPRCFRADPASWQCWGLANANRGVIVLSAADALWWSAVNDPAAAPLQKAKWGRLVVIDGIDSDTSPIRAAFAYPVPPPPERLLSMRLDTAAVAGAQFALIAPHAIWIASGAPPPKAWAEIRTDDSGPAYLPLADSAAGPAALPLHVRLGPRRTLAGKATGGEGQPASRALVTVFRAIDPPAPAGSTVVPRRVLASEVVANDDGAFVVDGLGEADYEIVGWHTQLGRASAVLGAADASVSLILRAAGLVRGRVVSGGKPVDGADVISVPDMAAFNGAKDMTDVKGGDSRTGPDGRFAVMLAKSGGGELRIGGGRYAVTRVPLPRPSPSSLDLGDIELSAAIELTILLDREVGCTVRVVGPLGRPGLQVISAVRTPAGTFLLTIPEPGLWQFGLQCTGEKHGLSPGSLQVTPAHAGREVPFVVK